MLRLIFPILSFVLLGAHFLRAGRYGGVLTCGVAILLMFIRKSWIPSILKGALLIGVVVWGERLIELVQLRQAMAQPWHRLAVILGGVAVFTLASILPLYGKWATQRFTASPNAEFPSAVAFFVTTGLLMSVHLKAPYPMLLLERYLVGGEWLAILLLGLYAAWIVEKMLDTTAQAKWRVRVWMLFSVVFFGQAALGLMGLDGFQMTGDLHLPIPAIIIAGPIYRGDGFFMPILFITTLLIVGPAWCSHLCYIGAWDNTAALNKRRPIPLSKVHRTARLLIFVCVVVAALICRVLGVSASIAGAVAVGFGLIGVGWMAVYSRQKGTMTHCTVYCPIGLVANLLGKLNPFRIRIYEGCTRCGKCANACRYNALLIQDIENRRPGVTCTLCGDCVGTCGNGQIRYALGSFNREWVRTAFIVLVSSIHALFMGVARL